MKAIGYIRVSTEEQAQSGLGLEAQRTRVTAYATAMGIELLDVVEDAGISAKTMDRPGLQAVLARIASGEAEGLIVLKLDRLSRSVRDTLDLVQSSRDDGWRLISVNELLDTGTATGRAVVTILAALSEMEREQIGERTSAALQALKARGVKLGRPALEVDPFAAELARGLHADGMSASAIARELNAQGLRTPVRTTKAGKVEGGCEWTHVQVGHILRREVA